MSVVMLNVALQSVVILSVFYVQCRKQDHYAECYYEECRHAESRYAERRDFKCRHAECHYAECRGTDKPSHHYVLSLMDDVGCGRKDYKQL